MPLDFTARSLGSKAALGNSQISGKFFWFAIGGQIGYIIDVSTAENKFLKEAIKQGLRMQHRFLAEPVLARTGKGYLKSEGVTTLQRIKANLKKSKSH